VDPMVALRSLPGTGALEVAPGRAVIPELGDPMAAVPSVGSSGTFRPASRRSAR
jgi:hypothetical protein